MNYNLELEDLKCLLNLEYQSVPCLTCLGKGVEYVCENGNVHPSRSGFEDTWFYDCMEQTCEDCNGLRVKVLLDTGVQL